MPKPPATPDASPAGSVEAGVASVVDGPSADADASLAAVDAPSPAVDSSVALPPRLRRGGRSTGRSRGPNLRDVAAAADVSVATVSLVLNDSQRISRATRIRVRRVMDKLGYQPNRLAQSLSGRYTKVLAVLLPAIRHAFADAYFGELLSGISDAAHAAGHKILLEQAKPDYIAAGRHLELFERRHVDGVLLLGTSDEQAYVGDFGREGHPALVVDNLIDLPARADAADAQSRRAFADYVMSDYRSGAEQAMNYLHQLGHRRIALLAAAPEIATTRLVREVWHRFSQRSGIDADECRTLIADGQFTESGGAAATARLLKLHPDLTAILAMNDKMALGAMHLLDRRGDRVPSDISVIGFDDLQHAAFVNPSLTTIHLPLYEVGQRACQRLIDRVQGKVERVTETLRTHLVVRDSTAMARRESVTGGSTPLPPGEVPSDADGTARR